MLAIVAASISVGADHAAAFREMIGILNNAKAPYNIASGTALNWHRNESLASDIDFEIERVWLLQQRDALHVALRRGGWKQVHVFGVLSVVGYEEAWSKHGVKADLFSVDRVPLVPPRHLWVPVPVSAAPLAPAPRRIASPQALLCCAPSHARCNWLTGDHNFTIPRCELENLHTMLRWVRDVLSKAVPWWLTAGALLSALRACDISHDTDIDVSVELSAWPIAEKLIKAAVGRTHYEFKPGNHNPARLFWGFKNRVHVDFWTPKVLHSATAVSDPALPAHLPAQLYFPLAMCTLEGTMYPCPHDGPGWLQLRFGAQWPTAKRKYGIGATYADNADLLMNATTWMQSMTVNGRAFPCYITRLGRERHRWHGALVSTPSPIEPYLVAKYGTAWALPDPTYQWHTSPFRADDGRKSCFREPLYLYT